MQSGRALTPFHCRECLHYVTTTTHRCTLVVGVGGCMGGGLIYCYHSMARVHGPSWSKRTGCKHGTCCFLHACSNLLISLFQNSFAKLILKHFISLLSNIFQKTVFIQVSSCPNLLLGNKIFSSITYIKILHLTLRMNSV